MPALTFETLSAELTKALVEQRMTPPKTVARCTLGRNKVLVLVEFPLDSAKAETFASQTLSWLEQHLRDRFDTTGLPDEVADISEETEEVTVQLYLKHLSEAKPFTMRSFTWKVGDGFDDLFGDAAFSDTPPSTPASVPAPIPEEPSTDTDPADALFAETPTPEVLAEAPAPAILPGLPDGEEERVLSELEDDSLPLDVDADDDLDAAIDDLLIGDADSAADLGDDSDFDLELAADTELTGTSLGANPDFLADADLGLDLEMGTASAGMVPDFSTGASTNSGAALDADLSAGISGNQPVADSATEFSLPGEAPALDSAELDLPTVDLPIVVSPDDAADSADFFELLPSEGVDISSLSDQTLDSTDFEEADEGRVEDDGATPEGSVPEGSVPEESVLEESVLEESVLEESVLEESISEESVTEESVLESPSESPALQASALEVPVPEESVLSSAEATGDEATAPGKMLEAFAEPVVTFPGSENSQVTEDAPAVAATDDLVPADLDGLSVEPSLIAPMPTAEIDEPVADVASSDNSAAELYAVPSLDRESYEEEGYEEESYEDKAYEEESYEEETYEDDPAYYLESDADDAAPADYEDVALVDEMDVQRQREQWRQWQQQSKGNPLIIFGAVGVVLLGVVGFVLTRPCTIGGCDRLETARLQGNAAIDSLGTESSLKEVLEAKEQIQDTIQTLEPIPSWSAYHDDAQEILPAYERQLSDLDLVSTAQQKAYSAAVESQEAPLSSEQWQGIADQWREATTELSKVPLDSPVRPLAERKLVEYRTNLSTILVRVETESGAEVSLRQAQNAASLATQQQPNADTLENLEIVLQNWETAVENLQRIPQGTKAYAEAQQILPEYEEKLLEIRTRVEQERNASRIIDRTERLATDARSAESEEQWTTSVGLWNQALIQLREVPDASIEKANAQSLLTTYTRALDTAENNMEVALRFQPIEPSFFLVCGINSVQKCSYSISAGNVRVDLFDGYDAVINESITPPPQRTGINPDAQLVSQSNQLLQQVTLLSTQAQVPVELYDAEGNFMARYRPDLDGFVRQ